MYLDLFIKELRNSRKMTQQQFADALGVSRTTIKNMENGTTTFPQKNVMKALADYMVTSELDIANKIIFPKKSIEEMMDQPVFEEFIAYMSLNGWNVEYNPMMHSVFGKPYFYAGVISKKREHNNSYLVAEFSTYYSNNEYVDGKFSDYMEEFLLSIISTAMKTDIPFRGVYVVFDDFCDDEGIEHKGYEEFSKLRINKIALDIQAVLFTAAGYGEIVDKKKLGDNKVTS